MNQIETGDKPTPPSSPKSEGIIDISDAGSVLQPNAKPAPAKQASPARPSNPRRNNNRDKRQERTNGGARRPNRRDRSGRDKKNFTWAKSTQVDSSTLIKRAPTETLRIIPLGGSGETGDKNMLVFEYGNDIIVIDAGIKFPTPDMPGIDYVINDTTYLEQNRDRVRAFVVTHGHEDHIGGFPYIWPKFPVPIYTAPLTAGFIKAKFEEHGIQGADFRIIKPGDNFNIGAFQIEPVRMTHSIPDILGLAITTPIGLVYHATDWKVDFTPTFGESTDFAKLSELSDRGIVCLLSDSTTVDREGFTISEQVVSRALEGVLAGAKGRVIVSSFSSRIDRMQHVVNACAKLGRKLVLSGRSMERNANIAMDLGYLKVPQGLLADMRTVNSIPEHKLVIMSTGSQGEEGSALTRMAAGEHRHIRIKKGDTIVLSSSVVPGNERNVEQNINNLYRLGAEVITNKNLDIHSSGHAHKEEVKLLISLLKPKYLMPIHGDYRRFVEHAKLAVEVGMKEENCMIVENGQVLEFDLNGNGKIAEERVHVGQVLIDGSGIGDVGEIVLRDRQTMAKDGVFLVILTIDGKTGRLMSSPDIISRGFVYMKESEELIGGARALIRRVHTQSNLKSQSGVESLKKTLRDQVSDYLYEKTQRTPMVISVVVQV